MEKQQEPINWQEVGKQLQASMNAFTEQFNAFATAFMTNVAESIKPTIDAGIELLQHVHEVAHTAYINDGAIYGDTHEGLLRWIREQGESTDYEHRQTALSNTRQPCVTSRG